MSGEHLFGLIGEHLGHSYSREIHSLLTEDAYSYELIELIPDSVEPFLAARAFAGINVTIPYKQTVMPFLDEISPEAQAIGCVNTIINHDCRLTGYNTDSAGFEFLTRRSGIDFARKKVLILGSGGTSLTAQAAVRAAGARELVVMSRRGSVTYADIPQHRDAEIIVNTTSVGMFPKNGERLLTLADFPDCHGVIDVIYNPMRTALLLEAEERGIPHGNGLPMLVAQARFAADLFMGSTLPDDRIETVIRLIEQRSHNLVLIGMPGCGKSTVGRLVAELSGKPFVDLDVLIEQQVGKPIPEIFAQEGESAFRDLEQRIAAEAGSGIGQVIATGGGVVLRKENIAALRQNGLVFFLERPLSELPKENRPMSLMSRSLEEMYQLRLPAYKASADFVIDNHRNPGQTACEIVQRSETC